MANTFKSQKFCSEKTHFKQTKQNQKNQISKSEMMKKKYHINAYSWTISDLD